MKTLFCVLGRTAAGKDTLVHKLCEDIPSAHMVISYTTRPRRFDNENTHYFVDESRWESCKSQVAAATTINGYHYWTTKEQILDSDFYIIDVEGLNMLRQTLANECRIVTIYITAPISVRQNRFFARQPHGQELFAQRSISEDKQFSEFEEEHDYDYCISNVDFEAAYAQFKSIYLYERNR